MGRRKQNTDRLTKERASRLALGFLCAILSPPDGGRCEKLTLNWTLESKDGLQRCSLKAQGEP